MKNTHILSLFVILTILVGCSKEFSEIDPIGQISSDNYLKNESEVFSALIGVYNTIQHNYSHGGWASVYFMKNLPADDCLAAGGSTTDQAEYQYLDDFLIGSDNSKIETIWTNFYKTINACNTIINVVSTKEEITDNMSKMVGEAKALRAFTYFELVTIFGGVPLMTVNPVAEADYHKPRATEAEVYVQIEKDFKDAIDVLPLKTDFSAENKFRFSKGAAMATLGKAYLYQKKYSEAATLFEQLISTQETTVFGLEPNFEDVWSAAKEFGVESLFEISYISTEGYDWGNFSWSGGNENNIEVQLQGPRDAIFDLGGSNLGIINGWGFNLPSKKIGDLFISEGETSRYNGTLISADDLIASGGSIKAPPADGYHDYEGYMRVKYVTRLAETNTTAVPELNYTVNWRIIRWADVLLMAAEAYNKTGKDDKALVELNKVRARAGFDQPVTATGDNLFNTIVKERQIELAFEGSRYWDLVRWGLAEQELGDLGFVKGKHEHFPIPLNEIIANNAINDADQNPGY